MLSQSEPLGAHWGSGYGLTAVRSQVFFFLSSLKAHQFTKKGCNCWWLWQILIYWWSGNTPFLMARYVKKQGFKSGNLHRKLRGQKEDVQTNQRFLISKQLSALGWDEWERGAVFVRPSLAQCWVTRRASLSAADAQEALPGKDGARLIGIFLLLRACPSSCSLPRLCPAPPACQGLERPEIQTVARSELEARKMSSYLAPTFQAPARVPLAAFSRKLVSVVWGLPPKPGPHSAGLLLPDST